MASGRRVTDVIVMLHVISLRGAGKMESVSGSCVKQGNSVADPMMQVPVLKSFKLGRLTRNNVLLQNGKVPYHARGSASLDPILCQLVQPTPSYAVTVGSISVLTSHLQLVIQGRFFLFEFFQPYFYTCVPAATRTGSLQNNKCPKYYSSRVKKAIWLVAEQDRPVHTGRCKCQQRQYVKAASTKANARV
jgi:hypothetical protein